MARRRSRKGKPSRSICNQDFISELPNEILTSVLSFLPTKSSVQTSVLSKRWSRLWISVPTLDFNGCLTECSVRQAQFENFVDRFLTLNTVKSVRRIHLDCAKIRDIARVNAWIDSIAKRDAEKVEFKLPKWSRQCPMSGKDLSSQVHSPPDNFYIQSNLVKLKLSDVVLKIPQSVHFPNLKKMALKSTHFSDDNSLKNLLSGSPVLTSLCMYLQRNNKQTLHICSSSLHDLVLRIDMLHCDESLCNVIIDTPNLRDLYFKDSCYSTYNIINLSSLVSAYLCIGEDGEILLELLRQISHVKELELFAFVLNLLPCTSLGNLPIFHNLTHLNVGIELDQSWEVLSHLFLCTPNLTTVIIHESGVIWPCYWRDPSDVPRCFLSCIESVEIIGFEEEEDEVLRMISYFLKNARVLKKLSVHRPAEDFLQEDRFRKALMSLPKSSATCQVEYTVLGDDDSSHSSR